MVTQKRIFEGAKTEIKISKGKNPKPYLHKIFNVTFTDDDIIHECVNNEGELAHYIQPKGISKIRSVFIFNVKRKNTLSVMVISLTPKYNNKGKLITEMTRNIYRVNPVTKKVWIQNKKHNVGIEHTIPHGWNKNTWVKEILEVIS
jgi:hypothetical protein